MLRIGALGRTDLNVSGLCLGTMHFGTREDSRASYAVLDRFVEEGGNFLDSANAYAAWLGKGGESETLLGAWMNDRANRRNLVIATKVGCAYADVEAGVTPARIIAECDRSLRRLGTDVIDLYYAHVDDRSTPMEAQLEAFDSLVRAGKVRYVGASNFRAWRLAEAEASSATRRVVSFSCVQQRFSYLRPRVDAELETHMQCNDDLFDFCRSRALPVLGYSPLLGGAYGRRNVQLPRIYAHADTVGRLSVLDRVAHDLSLQPEQVVLAWVVANGVLPICGASSPEQISANVVGATFGLSPELLERLNQAGDGQATNE
ncbi:MAG: aldo/keto reductase [Thermoanaerobaculia bacterium]|jgi:aryl-alcohol dehydrogenase-like predicted oxidoreductase